MAYVAPNSTIQLFKGINLDNRYLHTIYFASEAAQDTWFTAKVTSALTFSNMMYRRYTSEAIKVEADATTLLGVTYMRFKNTRTANKWFYAFVTAIDYVNEHTTVVYYEIDVMQTWFMQGGSVRPCMVLREHANTDAAGDNLLAEPIGSEVYDYDYLSDCDFEGQSIVAQTTGQSGTDQHMTQGIFTGCKYYTHELFSGTGDYSNLIYADIENMLGSWSAGEQEEDLVDLYTVPSFCVSSAIRTIHPQNTISKPSQYDTYVPKNKKMLTYPYSFLAVTTHTGDGGIYRWEYFELANPQFDITGTYVGGGEILCIPRAYNGQDYSYDNAITMNNFPKNAFAYDAYQAWIASGGTTRLENSRVVSSVKGAAGVMSVLGGLVSGIAPSTNQSITSETINRSGNVGGNTFSNTTQRNSVTDYTKGVNVGTVSGVVASALNTAGGLIEARNNLQYQFKDAAYIPNIVVGKQACNLAMQTGNANYYFYHTHVRDSEARRIDDFFSCYGYATNKVKTPNLTGRQYWNFVQTQDAVIAGDMPSSSKEAIGRIFDSGITLWHNGDNVGNYAISTSNGSINNPIIS